MTYNVDALKSKLDKFSGSEKKLQKKNEGPQLTYFKPQLGESTVRFLPYKDTNGQPFEEIAFYDNKDLSDRRLIVPSQFGLPDPIQDFLVELRKDRSKEAWKVIKALSPRTRYFAQIIDRADEAKGIQVWEFSQTICKDIYSILVHEDYRDEDMMSAESGYDFGLSTSVVQGKTFNGYPVKEIKIIPRRKSSKLAKNAAEIEKLTSKMVDMKEFFKAFAMPPDKLQELLGAFLHKDDPSAAEATDSTIASTSVEAAVDNLEDQFSNL